MYSTTVTTTSASVPRLAGARLFIELAAIFALSFLVIFLAMDRNVSLYDEGIILTGAMRVGAGDIIHRDFYANYGPAQFYIVAWFLKIFGHHVLAERAFDLLVRAGIATVIYGALVHYASRRSAAVATIVCVAWLSTVGNHGYPVYPALLLALASTLIMTAVIARGLSVWHAFAAGIVTGTATLFRYDIGFFIFIAHTLTMAVLLLASRKRSPRLAGYVAKNVMVYACGVGLPVLMILLLYVKLDAFSAFVQDVIEFPAKYYKRTRSLPFPPVSNLGKLPLFAIYIPVLVCITAIVGFLGRQLNGSLKLDTYLGSRNIAAERMILAFFLTALVAIFYLKGIVRVSLDHMQLALLPAIMLLSLVFAMVKPEKTWFRGASGLLVLLCIVTAFLSGYKKLAYNYDLVLRYALHSLKAVAGSGNTDGRNDDQKEAIYPASSSLIFIDGERARALDFIRKNFGTAEYFYAGLTHHDKVFVNDVSVYFMVNKLPATKWNHFDPGLQSSARIQSQIISDLEQRKPGYVWLESTWEKSNEPNESALSSGVTILDTYFLKNYVLTKKFGMISILQRKPGPAN